MNRDLASYFFTFCDYKDYGRLRRVCRAWNTILCIKTWPITYRQFTGGRTWSGLYYAMLRYPEVRRLLNRSAVSANPLITYDMITSLWYNDGFWDWQQVWLNPSVTWSDISKESNIRPVDLSLAMRNPNITLDIIVENNLTPTRNLSWNPSITYADILSRPGIPWDWNILSCSRNIPPDVFLNYNHTKLDWNNISQNPSITADMVLKYPHKPWSFRELSMNTSITPAFVLTYSHYDWDWGLLSKNPAITLEFMLKHPKLPWDFYYASANPSITWEQIVHYSDTVRWNTQMVSENPNITYEIVLANPDYDWDHNGLSENPSITWHDVLVDLESDAPLNWNWYMLSSKIK